MKLKFSPRHNIDDPFRLAYSDSNKKMHFKNLNYGWFFVYFCFDGKLRESYNNNKGANRDQIS
jgi:hypothetical protein